MSLHSWWLFVATVFLLSGTPGPNMLHIMTRSLEVGLQRSVMAMLGCIAAVVLMLLASAFGLAALLLALPGVFDILRYMGAAYLILLGVKAWCAPVSSVSVQSSESRKRLSKLTLFRTGFAVGISNPKLILFSAAFLPQFINVGKPHFLQFLILIVTFAAIEGFWYGVYAFGGRSLSRFLMRVTVRKWFNRITGGIFACFGAALLKLKPAG
ncbi:LysE family translocator [Acetobacter sp.]|nr:LysE family translocator [Acetobacter sp.]MCH4092694.1 LysE family translocator [Acetobacter sp.]MCI1301204.1 LysE family translocator [Acetobacter sp.]MCI1317465.1 LysE family translocator [Acetobacter sp.]